MTVWDGLVLLGLAGLNAGVCGILLELLKIFYGGSR